MRRTVAAVFAAGLAVGLLAGCSDDSDDSATPSAAASSVTDSTSPAPKSGEATSKPAGGTNLRADCAGLSSDDLTEIFDVEFGRPEPSTGAVNTVDNVNYKTVGCSFETTDLATTDLNEIEVDLNLSFAEQFNDNTVHCIEPSDHIHPVEPVAGVGNQAWWQSGSFENATDAEGELTVCVDEALIGIQIEGPSELRATMQDQAVEIARIVVG
ncbi:hypothetical protein [Nocardia sp. 348MFTsu5.1]|uniref:hypothetical protein n=1 Tax=Nocardia sp. 348MFTsu5.1 TaxID=1172185 RepID=UPI00036F620C|nr:hypothetical protein [Nocardia sp. 348MFTsu5.1]